MMTENLTEKPDRKNLLLKVWCVCTAFLILMLTTRSSFLFPINNWDDVNSYFSMGKGMMNGMVIYRDLYDQKGPYLYLLFGISYLISHRTFLGVFVFEVAAAAVTLYFAGKYILRYSGFKAALFMIPILGAGMYSSWSFYWGGAAEEFCLPMFAASVYFLEGILKDRYSGRELAGVTALTGIFAGVTAQVKYTMLGFYAAWFILAVLWIAKTAGVRDAFLKGVRFILFALLPSVPWFIYFLATGSLDDWYRCYIYNNLFFYTDVSGVDSFVSKLYAIAKTLYWLIQDSFSYFVFIISGFILQFVKEKGVLRRISSLFVFALTYFVIFIGGNKLAYYSIPLMSLAIPGAAYISGLLSDIRRRMGMKSGAACSLIAASLFAGVLFAGTNCMSADFRKENKDDFWLYRMADMMEVTPDTTLLNVNSLDVGLYTVTGIVPNCEYFQTNGIGLPTLYEEQDRYIEEGITDYVVAGFSVPEKIFDHYEQVTKMVYNTNGEDRDYYLFRKVR